ncbi:VanZ family protein [Uruburuella testudinis]|uniref:VanZ family protein n=1 Tax=Uruburuella testudinis TaxID=1282863 RepID=A0ABY4DRI1_9NEIS|nr:VanZ family protein [Uruburuella testudinis]UOO81330.1 VanZ family protein [Uruburuella testudinis]
MNIPTNKFTLLALLWFGAGVYSLVFREAESGAPPFAHFDKIAHFALFFGQFWLIAKALMQARQAIPYTALLACAVLFAAGSETAQALFTQTRQGSAADALADIAGAASALWLAHKVTAAKLLPKAKQP